MAGLTSDVLLQNLLDESTKGNEHLKSMRDLLISIERSSGNGGGDGGSPGNNGNRRESGSFTKALKSVFGEAKNVGSTVLGNAGSVQNTVASLGTSASVLSDSFAKLPGPIGLVGSGFMQVVAAGAKLYEYMNQQLEMYNQLNSAGVTLSNGMITARKGAAATFMSMNEFQSVLTKNSDALAAMEGEYGNGVEYFGKLMNSVQLAQEAVGLYGMSQSQLADLAAKNFKFNKMFSAQEQNRSMSEAQSTQKFIGTMNYLSKSVGKSVDELLNKFTDMSTNIDTGSIMSSLQNSLGIGEEQSAEMAKTYNAIYASMGDAGTTLQNLNANKLGLHSLPEEFNNSFTQLYTDMIVNLQRSGETDQQKIRQRMSQFVKENEAQLKLEADMQRLQGNTVAEQWLRQLQNVEKTLNDPKNQPTPIFDDMMNRFNLWIGKSITQPLNEYFAHSQEQLASYLLDVSNSTDNAFDFAKTVLVDGYVKINEALGGMLNAPYKMFTLIGEMIWGEKFPQIKESVDTFLNSFIQIPYDLVKTLWAWASGGDVEGASTNLRVSIKMFFDDLASAVTNVLTMNIDFKAVKERIFNAFTIMTDGIVNFFKNMTSWFSTDDSDNIAKRREEIANKKASTVKEASPKAKGNEPAKPTSNAEYTKPEEIQQSENTQAKNEDPREIAKTQLQETANKLLTSILNSLENQNGNASQTLASLRQIAENTEAPRNV